jgi:hypothetical protein
MRPQTYLHASCPAQFSRLSLDSPHDFCPGTGATLGVAQALRRLVALAMTLLVLPLGQGELFAQQAPTLVQEGSQNDPYNGQYAPDQQPGYRQQPYAASGQVYPHGDGPEQPPAEPLNAEQIEQLVAPIALYPDTLVAQVLAASTYPVQVVDADRWRQAQGYASPDQIAAGADAQTWDPSLKVLTAFPQVLAEMDRNLQWTTDLGNAYYNQPQDVLQAVQVMRQRAQAAGNLRNTSQEAVNYDQGNIELAPTNPQVVYVPSYNPWGVYGQPVSPYPGFSLLGALGSFFGSSPVRYGLGIAMTAFSHTTWGWLAWGLSWLSQSVLFHQANYYSHSTTVSNWGFPHGGQHALWERRAIAMPNSSKWTPGSDRRPSRGYSATPGQGFVPRPPDRYAGNRPGEGSSRSYQTHGVSYARPPLEANNHIQPPASKPQEDGRPGYGSSFYGRPRAGYSSRLGAADGSPPRAYRAPRAHVQPANFGAGSPGAFAGRGFAGSSAKPAHSRLFRGGRASENFNGGGRAPKAFRGGKNFNSRRSGGGSHSGGHSSGKHRH